MRVWEQVLKIGANNTDSKGKTRITKVQIETVVWWKSFLCARMRRNNIKFQDTLNHTHTHLLSDWRWCRRKCSLLFQAVKIWQKKRFTFRMNSDNFISMVMTFMFTIMNLDAIRKWLNLYEKRNHLIELNCLLVLSRYFFWQIFHEKRQKEL